MIRTILAAFAFFVSATWTVASAQVPSPTLEGPISGGNGSPSIFSTTFDLAEVGYLQEEFFISGTATAYTSAAPLTSDGNWTAMPASTAPYKTRILVYPPMQRARFNGTVVVEWLNVSGSGDGAVDWIMSHTELIRGGYAWVGVSAQKIGVEGGTSVLGLPIVGIKGRIWHGMGPSRILATASRTTSSRRPVRRFAPQQARAPSEI